MHVIDKILSRKEFEEQPPVLLDIGASGAIHFRWKKIARYCICIAFDPDEREYGYIESENKNYKRLFVFNCVISDETQEEKPFYLTASPYCSSFLEPRNDKLAPYAFAPKFKIAKETSLPVKCLSDVLQELNIQYIDWFKTDSQGMDLRIFKSLSPEIIQRVAVAEFEPGIMDAYKGEDKLHEVLSFMEKQPFFLSHFEVKGSSRLSFENIQSLAGNKFKQKLLAASHKKTAGWGELLYLNTFESAGITLRDFLLGIAIAFLNKEYGFALELTQKAQEIFTDNILNELRQEAERKIKRAVFELRFMKDIKKKILKES